MEENKFEKQVQKKMVELNILPSDAVWKKIEVRIEKKKRSRWILPFLLLFAGLLAGGYLLWNGEHHTALEKNDASITIKNTTYDPINGKRASKAKTNIIPDTLSQKEAITVEDNAMRKTARKIFSKHLKLSTAARIHIKTQVFDPGITTQVISPGIESTDPIPQKIKIETVTVQPEEITTTEKSIVKQEDSSIKNAAQLPASRLKEKASVKDSSIQTAATPQAAKGAKNKWETGLLITGGISGVGNNFLGLVNSPVYLYSTLTGTAPPLSVSRSGAGVGFTVGIIEEKNISPKTRIVLGINFTSFNTFNMVGIDSARSYSPQNATNRYINHYHFIELPISFKLKVGYNKKLPLFWQGGVVLSELISSNALQYNQSNGTYATNNSLFNKTQIGFNTSFSIALFSKQKKSILLGPSFYYDATKVANEGLYNKKHFVYVGLRTEIILGKH